MTLIEFLNHSFKGKMIPVIRAQIYSPSKYRESRYIDRYYLKEPTFVFRTFTEYQHGEIERIEPEFEKDIRTIHIWIKTEKGNIEKLDDTWISIDDLDYNSLLTKNETI